MIQTALDETRALHIPARDQPDYLDGPLILSSGHRLTAEPTAEIRFKPASSD